MSKLVQSSLSAYPASSACILGCDPLLCCGIQAPTWSLPLESTLAMWLLRPHGYYRERTLKQHEHRLLGKRKNSLFPWDYIILGLGRTRCLFFISGLGRSRCFFKIMNQLPKLFWASDGSTP